MGGSIWQIITIFIHMKEDKSFPYKEGIPGLDYVLCSKQNKQLFWKTGSWAQGGVGVAF